MGDVRVTISTVVDEGDVDRLLTDVVLIVDGWNRSDGPRWIVGRSTLKVTWDDDTKVSVHRPEVQR